MGFVDKRFCGRFECVLAIDHDKAAVLTHQYNFSGDALQVNIEEWISSNPLIPSADVVIGGPPCQGFSLLNKNRIDDARRELWEPYMDVVERSRASVFVMENVPEILNSDEFQKITVRARQMGFTFKSAVLNAADYGAPQVRKRAIIIGLKFPNARFDFPPEKTHSGKNELSLLPAWCTVRDAIADLPMPEGTEIRNSPPPLNLHFTRNPTPESLKRYKAVPLGGNRFDLQRNAPEITPACWIRKTSGGTDLFGRLWWDRPSVTIRTEFFKPEKGRYLHPDQHRPITHREAARLMGFPDDFHFVGTKVEIARQIGNAVCPPLAGAIGTHVADLLEQAKEEESNVCCYSKVA